MSTHPSDERMAEGLSSDVVVGRVRRNAGDRPIVVCLIATAAHTAVARSARTKLAA